mgnify:CR=1 FL=1
MSLKKKAVKALIYQLVIYALAVLIVSLFWKNNPFTFAALVALLILIFSLRRSSRDLLVFLIAVLAGSLGEIVCIALGIWNYTNASFLGIPLWLPLLWGIAGIMLLRISETVHHLVK